MVIKKCFTCNKEFKSLAYYKRKYCSRQCSGLVHRKRIYKKCLICKTAFYTWPSKNRIKYCSKKCQWIARKDFRWSKESKQKMSKSHKGKKLSIEHKKKISIANSGPNCHCWKGGKYKSNGYWYILKPQHLFCNADGYVLQSHLVMEKHLGRYLKKGELVHHKGIKYPLGSIKNKQDDRIENLEITNRSKHARFHTTLRYSNLSQLALEPYHLLPGGQA